MAEPAADIAAAYDAVVARVLAHPGVVVVLGASDSGKTTMARRILSAAVDAGTPAAWVDTDVGQSTVGPPTTVGLRHIRASDDLADPFPADELYFVGGVSPRGHFLPLVAGTARLVASARRRCDLVVVDTCGFVTGVAGQRLKLHTIELAGADHVIGLGHGDELEPLLAVARRFTDAQVSALSVHPDVVPRSAEQRAENRRRQLARYLAEPLQRFPVASAVFMPALLPGVDLAALHGLLVGVSDRAGGCLGLGVLEHADGGLRLASPVAQAPTGLQLGSTLVDDTRSPRSVDLRELLGSA